MNTQVLQCHFPREPNRNSPRKSEAQSDTGDLHWFESPTQNLWCLPAYHPRCESALRMALDKILSPNIVIERMKWDALQEPFTQIREALPEDHPQPQGTYDCLGITSEEISPDLCQILSSVVVSTYLAIMDCNDVIDGKADDTAQVRTIGRYIRTKNMRTTTLIHRTGGPPDPEEIQKTIIQANRQMALSPPQDLLFEGEESSQERFEMNIPPDNNTPFQSIIVREPK